MTTVIKSKGERFNESAMRLAAILNDIFARKREHELAQQRFGLESEKFKYAQGRNKFTDILSGVSSGLVDPDESLIAGTPGGNLYQQYLGVTPPQAPRQVVVEPERQYEGLTTPEFPEPLPPEDVTIPAKTKREGGFPVRSQDALKRWIANMVASGRQNEIPLEAYSAAGLRRDDLIERKLDLLRESIAAKEREGVRKTETADRKILAIGEFKNKELAARVSHWKALEQQADTRMTKQEEAAKRRDYVNLFSTVSKHVGADLAPAIASSIIEDGNLNDIPDEYVSKEVKRRIQADLSRKERAVNLKERTLSSVEAYRGQKLAIDEAEFNRKIDQFNVTQQMLSQTRLGRSEELYRKALESGIKSRLSSKNASERGEGERMLAEYGVNFLGWEADDPTGWEALKAFAGRLFGVEMGEPTLRVPGAPPSPATQSSGKQPFNPPRVEPKLRRPDAGVNKPGVNVGKPMTAEQYKAWLLQRGRQ